MKKILSILVVMMFLLSALPLALAEDTTESNGVVESDGAVELDGAVESNGVVEVELDVGDTDVATSVTEPKDKIVKLKIRARTTVECVDRLKAEYPRAQPERIRIACAAAFRVASDRARDLRGTELPGSGVIPEDEDSDDAQANEDSKRPVPRAVAVRRLSAVQTQNAEKIMNRLSVEKKKVLEKLDRSRLKECLEDVEECGEKMKNYVVKTDKVKNLLKKREIAKDKLEKAKERFEKAKDAYANAKQNHKRVRENFNGLKGELEECQESGEDCSELEEQILVKAKENLDALIDRLIQHLEKVASQVQGSEEIDSEEASEAESDLNDLIGDLEAAKEKLESITDKEGFDAVAEEVRAIWNEIEFKAKKDAESVIRGYVKGVFVKSELLETKLDRVLDRLEEKGVEVDSIEALLDSFSDYVDSARDKIGDSDEQFDLAKDLRSAGDNEGAKKALDEAKSLARQAHDDLKESHKILMDLVREINQNGENFDPEELDEEEVVEVVEEVEVEEEAE